MTMEAIVNLLQGELGNLCHPTTIIAGRK